MPRIPHRRDYSLAGLHRKALHPDPIRQFDRWFRKALATQKDEAYAMTLATSDCRGRPQARVMLLRAYDRSGFTFYTNYGSRKSADLDANPYAAILFFWPSLERQVRVTGKVTRTSRNDAREYFRTRPPGNQLAAWVSHQSEVIPSHDALDERLLVMKEKFQGDEVPLPSWWGGYLVKPVTIEFWQGRPNRLHDRFRYARGKDEKWTIERLSP